MLGYISLDIICSSKLTVVLELRSALSKNCSLLGADNHRRQNGGYSAYICLFYIGLRLIEIVFNCVCRSDTSSADIKTVAGFV